MAQLREDLNALLQLQQIDSERDKLARQRTSLDNGAKLTADVAAAQAEFEKQRAALFQTNGSLKDAELELAGIEKKVETYEAKMRQGTVTNTREVMNFEKEFGQLNRQRAALDDKILNLMEMSETQTTSLKAAEGRVQNLERDHATMTAGFHEQLSKIEESLGRLSKNRQEIAKLIADPNLLKRYETLRARPGNSGVAIARTTANTCGACHMQIGTVAVAQAEIGNELTICENCGRIMA